MGSYRIVAFCVLIVFYGAYSLKVFLQRKKGIQTNQLGKGKKATRTIRVERVLRIASFIIVPIEVISIYFSTIENTYLIILGLVFSGLGILVFILAMWTMQDNWRAGIPAEDQTVLVTKGIYRWSRNPAFLGFDLMYVGILIAFYNSILLAATLVVIIMMHLQILEEEKFLKTVFKKDYEQYYKKTGRYFLFI